MLCQNCKDQQATIHLTEIVNGVRNEMHLCQQCAQEEGVAVYSQVPINELLTNLLANEPGDTISADSEHDLTCSHCGFTLGQFAQKTTLGCPRDYQIFEKSLLPLISKAHNGQTTHCGKVPSKIPQDEKKQIKLAGLQKKLEQAIKSENYELAAELRDKINQPRENKQK